MAGVTCAVVLELDAVLLESIGEALYAYVEHAYLLCTTYDFTIEKPDVYVNDGVMMMHHGIGISDTFKEDYYKPKKNTRFRTF